MGDETLAGKYKKALENNKAVAILLTVAVLAGATTAIVNAGKTLYAYLVPPPPAAVPPPTLEERVAAMAKGGCLLFKPDSAVVIVEDFVMNAYKDYWRATDIFYASYIRVEGVVHNRGAREYNLGTSERRASAGRDFLLREANIADVYTRIDSIGYGEEKPLERIGEYECGAMIVVGNDTEASTADIEQ